MRFRWNVHLACGCILDGGDSHQDYLALKERLWNAVETLHCKAHGKQVVKKIGGHSV